MYEKPSPLTDREIRILRGMIDEYQRRQYEARFFRGVWTSGKAFLVTLGIVITMIAQIVTMIAVLRGGH